MNFTEEGDRELVKKVVQGTSTAPANVVGERAANLTRETIESVRTKAFNEDIAMNMLMEVVIMAKAGKPWKEHMKLLQAALDKAPVIKKIIAEALSNTSIQNH